MVIAQGNNTDNTDSDESFKNIKPNIHRGSSILLNADKTKRQSIKCIYENNKLLMNLGLKDQQTKNNKMLKN